MKFVMSYSCGKESTLALHKMIEQGNEAVGLIIMINREVNRSFFHGADYNMIDRYSEALGIPVIKCPTDGADYHLSMEQGLIEAKQMGAVAACFGDIDIDSNRAWSEERCKNTQLQSVFPLWQRDRKENVYELVKLGYKCLIKSINTELLPKELLGQYIDEHTISIMEDCGVDICGENGEYHTLVTDGPIFLKPLALKTGGMLDFGNYSVVEVW